MQKHHTIEMIFPELLFVIFSLCALFLMTTGVMSYQKFNQQNDSDITTALAYIETKVNANNHIENINTTTIDNTSCLSIKSSIQNEDYTTYIYVYNNQLMELWIPEKETPHKEDGTIIMSMKSLSLSLDKQALTIGITDVNDRQKQLAVYLQGGASL